MIKNLLINILSYLLNKLDNEPCEISDEEIRKIEKEIKER